MFFKVSVVCNMGWLDGVILGIFKLSKCGVGYFNISQYDHHEFPGVVPRTFLGPMFISLLAAPIVCIFEALDINKFWTQYLVRTILAACVVCSFSLLCKTLEKQFGSRWMQWFIAVTITQSHFMFYLSRPLPNIMVLPLVLLALDGWLRNDNKSFILFSGASIIIFRAELTLLFGILLLSDLYCRRITLKRLFQIAVPGGIAFLMLTVIVDSIFWNRPLWPEGEVLWYNTILNKSSDWGTSPFLWYFYSAIPRGMAASLFLMPIGFILDVRVRKVVVPALLFVLLYSFLPHKELRFIIYVFPFLNVAAATACHRIWENRNKSPVYHFLSLGVAGHLAVNVIFTLFLLSISGTNYPGGTAIARLHRLAKEEPNVKLHICNLAAQTGVTRFTQYNENWTYSKKENLLPGDYELYQFTHLIAEAKSKFSTSLKPYVATHDIIDTIEAFHQVSFNYLSIPPVKIKTKPVLFTLKRKPNYKELLHIQGEESVEENPESSEDGKSGSQENLPLDASTDRSDESAEAQASSLLEEKSQFTKNEIQKSNDDDSESEEQEQVDSKLNRKSSVTQADNSEEHMKEIKKERGFREPLRDSVKTHTEDGDTVKSENVVVRHEEHLEVDPEKPKIIRESASGDRSFLLTDDIHQKVKVAEQNHVGSEEEDDVRTTEGNELFQDKPRFIKLQKVNGKKQKPLHATDVKEDIGMTIKDVEDSEEEDVKTTGNNNLFQVKSQFIKLQKVNEKEQKTSHAADDTIVKEDIGMKIKDVEDEDEKKAFQEKSRFIKIQNEVKQIVEPLESEESEPTDAEDDLPIVKTLPGKSRFVKLRKVEEKQKIEPEIDESKNKPSKFEIKQEKSRFIKLQKVDSDSKNQVSSPESPKYQPPIDYMKAQEKIKTRSIPAPDFVDEDSPETQQKLKTAKKSLLAQSAEEIASVPKIPKKFYQKPLEIKREDISRISKPAVSKFKVGSSKFEDIETKYTTKTKPLAKQQEGRETQIPIIRRLEDEYADNNKQHVKQNIRKLIQKYKRKKMDEEYIADENVRAKQHIRKIIEEERLQQQKDEINRIQEQIMDIIENNPKITNKNFIKSKLEETVIKELVNAIDLKVQSEATLKQFDMNADQNKGSTRRYLPKIPEKFQSEERLEDDLSLLSRSDENYETGEVGTPIAIVEKPVTANVGEMIEEEKIAFVKKFKKANEKLDNILTIIDEIVDTIEVTDEYDEDDPLLYR
ncbi:unnamed protein product [Callosobruchus maculatus]|uniref:Mannosyltransferase n=1 Tax=Callosobruchus maculatus TaxID=64391 RepID=A0A653CNE9_CALMS|nr:unnamed protein product [Callosobruchus maculatus]